MIDYNNLKAVYTVQWPFNHFDLEKKAYISEQIAKEKFEKKSILYKSFLIKKNECFVSTLKSILSE